MSKGNASRLLLWQACHPHAAMRMQCSLLYIGLAMMTLHSVDIPMEQSNYIQDGTILDALAMSRAIQSASLLLHRTSISMTQSSNGLLRGSNNDVGYCSYVDHLCCRRRNSMARWWRHVPWSSSMYFGK